VTPPPRGRGPRQRARDDLLFDVHRLRALRRKRLSRKHRLGGAAGILAVLAAILFTTVGIGGTVAYRTGCSLAALQEIHIGENSFIYAADGSSLGSIPAERNREPVPASKISPWMGKATVAIEDKRYWQHGGIDPIGMTRALWADVRAGKAVQGGSTITQQLVRNLYISRERTVQRKLKEVCLAMKLADKWSKEKILNEYMNRVYYGSQAYGIEAAAQTYFSKHAKRLTLAQSALLAGLPQAPSQYDPFQNPSAALARRNEVLRAMLATGAITADEYYGAIGNSDLELKPGVIYKKIKQPYFFSYVRDELRRVYGEARVRTGGLRVYTTIDPRLQSAAKKAIRDTLYLSDDPASAVVAINPATGAIRAMTAVYPGRTKNQYNLIAQAHRQAGSTFKVFVLAAAIEKGINPETTYYLSAPFHCEPPDCSSVWDPETYDHSYIGGTSLVNATLRSDNTVYARLTVDIGPETVAKMAQKLGVRTPLKVDGAYISSIGLGSIAVTPLDMASAYATLAAGGIYSKPMAITKVILPNGKEDKEDWGTPDRKRVVSAGVAYEVTKILQQNVQYGTGVGANPGRPAAGKTGTTDNHADAWFSGYVPQLQATVWVGYPRGEIPMLSVHGISVAGGTFPAQIWRLFMLEAIEKLPVRDFGVPDSLPTWISWRGKYQWGGGYYVAPSTTTTTGETTTDQKTTRTVPLPATTRRTPPPPPPTTTAPPPPPVTTEPPPATTTVPPPAPEAP
jgi:penicillin-binding protein 1A